MKQTKKVMCAFILVLAASMPCWAQITFSSWGRVVITPLAFTSSGNQGENYSAVSAATSTWGDAPYISFSANGKSPSENIGFNIDFDFGFNILNGNYNIVGDNAKVWLHPLGLVLPNQKNMIKLVAGRFNEDELRGKIGATEFGSWVLPNGSRDEDSIFTRFKATAGAYVRLEPLTWLDSAWNGLTLHMTFGSNALGANGNRLRAPLNLYNNEANQTNGDSLSYNDGWGDYDGDRQTSAKDVFRAGQYALGYRIPEIGLFRLQFIGSNLEVYRMDSVGVLSTHTRYDIAKRLVAGIDRGDSGDTLEFAFMYDGFKGLRVDAGFKLPFEYTTNLPIQVIPNIYVPRLGFTVNGHQNGRKGDDYVVQSAKVISLGANWIPEFLPELNIMTRFDCSFGGKIEIKNITVASDKISIEKGTILSAWLVPSYRITKNISVGMDMGMDIHTGDTVYLNGQEREEWTEVSTYNDFGVSPWTDIQLGGGRVRIGVVIMMPGSFRDKPDGNAGYVTPQFLGDPVISLPISVTYSF
jgi:hypothetical protein